MNFDWPQSFKAIYEKALTQYQQGNRKPETYFSTEEVACLASIGCKPIEIYDFVEDHPAIDWETALLITSVQRDHFLSVDGARSGLMSVDGFPAKDAEIEGIPWLPRLIMKAQGKLSGRLPTELMYCCGGDRAFFKKYNIHPADFLRLVWSAGDDRRKIVKVVKSHSQKQ